MCSTGSARTACLAPPGPVRPELVEGRVTHEPLDRIASIWQANRMSFWAYLLRCSDDSFYAGHTDSLETRIGAHWAGKGCDYTARRLPVSLAWCQDFPSRLEALEAERRIKGWSRAKKEALIAGDWERLSALAKAYGTRPSTGSGRMDEMSERVNTLSVRPEPVEGRVRRTVP